ncbi:4-hydroxysphinganine ceramide fatty acyl 2-hydroxylase [Porphyrobacter sp. MBR-155]|jgi:sterol desaturase/sphingolipid hydroxylase (fatty acid hydroxylase superfamily)|uniref:sterol desaturase family protein n=1 Tax=Porphyrobacter sp. MBR-155 TaxID=3156464 RepID=UPI0033935307
MNHQPHQSDRLVLFENRWLEKFTVISVGWFVAIWAVIVPLVVMTAWGTLSPLSATGLMLTGWFIWSIFEYIAHRKLFHFDTDRPWLERVVFVIHGNHHVQPRDELRNLMPPIVSVPVSMSIWALLWALAGDAGTWMFVGFIGGYVAYDLTHYACHHWPMRGRVGMFFKRHHMQHHFITGHGNFAITAIFWDYVFGTRVVR